MRRILIAAFSAALLVAACGDGSADAPNAAPPTTVTISSSAATTVAVTTTQPQAPTTTETTATSSTMPATTTLPDPPDEDAVQVLAWGLLCRDLTAAGWAYVDAVAYWNVEGRPARMDEDANGIPCESVYPASVVADYWGDPLPTGLAPGPGSGWRPSSREAPVAAACCAMNHNGPESPPLPPASGAFPDDGAFSIWATRNEGRTDSLELEIRRWLPCSERPDQCGPDVFPGDVYADPDNAVVRTLALDDALTVVIRPIAHSVDGEWVEAPIEGNGTALASLLRRIDAAVTTTIAPVYGSIDIEAVGAADPTFPYGPAPLGEDSGSVLAYRGPENSYLTDGLYAALGWDPPSWMYGWWCTLEFVGGAPVLYIWAGQIAG